MPRGENKDTAVIARPRSAGRRHNTATAPPPIAWDAPGGPEATEDELRQVLLDVNGEVIDHELEMARRAIANPEQDISRNNRFLPRRALEALLAAEAGEDPEAFKAANAHRSWLELYGDLQAMPEHSELRRIALEAENTYRRALAHGLDVGPDVPTSQYHPLRIYDDEQREEVLAAAAALTGGRATGRLEDYTRKELCELLGYLQRDAKDFSDEELRAMALDAHAVSHFDGAPTHAELALRSAFRTPRRWGSKSNIHLRAFRKALRTPYGELAGEVSCSDDGRIDRVQLAEALAERHPFFFNGAKAEHYRREHLERLAQAGGLAVRLPDEARRQAAVERKFVSSLDNRFGDAFDDYVRSLGGGHVQRVVGHGAGSGSWSKKARGARSAWGIYFPHSGEVHINPKLDRLISKAQQGKAEPNETYDAVLTIAHELTHGTSGGGAARKAVPRNTGWHTIEEGCTEAIARLKVDELAGAMGVWDSQERGSLRGANATRGCYPRQVEAMVTLCALATGQGDRESIEDGRFAHPEALGEEGRNFLQLLHTTSGDWEARIDTLTEHLAENTGASRQVAERCVRRSIQVAQRRRSQWRTARNSEGGWDYRPPRPFGEELVEELQSLFPEKTES